MKNKSFQTIRFVLLSTIVLISRVNFPFFKCWNKTIVVFHNGPEGKLTGCELAFILYTPLTAGSLVYDSALKTHYTNH